MKNTGVSNLTIECDFYNHNQEKEEKKFLKPLEFFCHPNCTVIPAKA